MNRWLAAAALGLVACAPALSLDEAEATGTTDATVTTSTPTGTDTTAADGVATGDSDDEVDDDDDDDDGYEEDDGADGCTFTCPSDPPPPPTGGGGFGIECSVALQDCPLGEKCNYWSADGGPLWSGTRCSELPESPDSPGEPCLVEGNGQSGIDSCDLGSLCFNVDPELNEGTCHPLCGGIPGAPSCPEDALCAQYGLASICTAPCDPLGEPCTDGLSCNPAGAVEAESDPLPPFFTCEAPSIGAINGACDPESAYVGSSRVLVDCDKENCCAQTCAPAEPDGCPTGTTCQPYLDPPPNAWVADVGLCLPPR